MAFTDIGFKAILYLCFTTLLANAADVTRITKAENEYGEMCGCKHIFYKNQFNATDDHFSGYVASTTIAYNGQCDKIETTRSTFSELVIPDGVIDCFMKGKVTRLTGYFLTESKKYCKVTAEYQLEGESVWHPMETKVFAGAPFWKQFDYYFDFAEHSTLNHLKLKVQSPVDLNLDASLDVVYPIYLDEFKICKFCDGNVENPLPALQKIEVNTGTLVALTDNNYLLNVLTGTSTVQVKPFLDNRFPGSTIKVNNATVSSGAFSSPITLNTDPDKSTYIYVEVVRSTCERNIYIIEAKIPEGPDATLYSLKTSVGTLSPDFYRFTTTYTATVPNGTNEIIVTPVANDSKATITVNGTAVVSGEDTAPIDISTNSTITIVVTAQDGITVKTYTVSVTEEGPEIFFAAATGIGFENTINPVITVTINPVPAAGKTYTIDYTVDPSSTASGGGVDFTLSNGSLSFDNLNPTRNIPLTIVNDAVVGEGAETVVLRLLNPTNGSRVGTPNIYTYTIKEVIYVKSGSAGNGTSWSNALGNLQDALAAAIRGSEIWIAGANNAAGMVYKPGPVGSPRTVTFAPRAGVALEGGFPGNSGEEGRKDLQNGGLYKTVLNGDLAGDDGDVWPRAIGNIDDNVFHVISIQNTGVTESDKILINGVYVINGNASYENVNETNGDKVYGGGIYTVNAYVNIQKCIFSYNHAHSGGGVYGKNCGINIEKTKIESNIVNAVGGGVNLANIGIPDPSLKSKIADCFIVDNVADFGIGGNGGGLCLYNPNAIVTNCIIARNTAFLQGGGIHIDFYYCETSLQLTNCTIVNNDGLIGPNVCSYDVMSLYCPSILFNVTNTLFWEDQTFSVPHVYLGKYYPNTNNEIAAINYSAINGGILSSNIEGFIVPGIGNIAAIPDFLNNLNDYHIATNSNCIDKGTSNEAPIFDIDGKPRYDHPAHSNTQSITDIGAYEFNPVQ